MRVYELAKELGVSAADLHHRLHLLGRPVRSSSSVLPPELEQWLRAAIRGGPPPTVSASADDDLAATARALGVDPARLCRQTPPSRGARPNRPAQRPADQVIAGTVFRRGGEVNEAAVAERWAKQLIPPDEMRAWRKVGLGPYDDTIAAACARAGISPEELTVVVDGRRAAARLRDGEPVGSVLTRLRKAGTKTPSITPASPAVPRQPDTR